MKILIFTFLAVGMLSGCATTHVADNVRMISFTDKPTTKDTKSVGNVEGKDCQWFVAGYPVGSQPTVRTAFQNAAEQKEELIPLMGKKKEGATAGNLSFIRNVAVRPSGFSAWVLGRTCLNVTGVGYQ